MNTNDIKKILTSDFKTSGIFSGVFSLNEFEDFLRRNRWQGDFVCVFNTHPSSKPGEHWIAFGKRNDVGFYLDSYGRHPSHYPDVYEILKKSFSKVVWNDVRLQGLTSNACGDYCVFTNLLVARGWSLRDVVNAFNFSKDVEDRDHAVRSLSVQLFGRRALTVFRRERNDLSGHHKLHINKAVILSSLLPSPYTN